MWIGQIQIHSPSRLATVFFAGRVSLRQMYRIGMLSLRSPPLPFKAVISQNFKLLVWIANITYFHFWYLTDTQLPPIRFHKLLHGFHNAHNQELVNSEFLEGSFVFRAIHEPNYYRSYRHNVHWGCNYLIVVTCDFIIYTVLNCQVIHNGNERGLVISLSECGRA